MKPAILLFVSLCLVILTGCVSGVTNQLTVDPTQTPSAMVSPTSTDNTIDIPSPTPTISAIDKIKPTKEIPPAPRIISAVGPVDPEPDPVFFHPPAATLTVAGQSQTAGVGTFCWSIQPKNNGPSGLCADMIGIPTAIEPLPVNSPMNLAFSLPIEQAPTELLLTVIPAEQTREMREGNPEGQRWWEFQSGDSHTLEPSSQPSISLDLSSGQYILDLFARWDNGNDVSYGFLLVVQ